MSLLGYALVASVCILGNILAENQETPYICVKWTSNGICVGGSDSLASTDVVLTYGMPGDKDEFEIVIKQTVNIIFYPLENCSNDCIYLLEQREHGGGECNCVDIYFNSSCPTNGDAT